MDNTQQDKIPAFGLQCTVWWTEIREAIIKDFPQLQETLPRTTGPNTTKFIKELVTLLNTNGN